MTCLFASAPATAAGHFLVQRPGPGCEKTCRRQHHPQTQPQPSTVARRTRCPGLPQQESRLGTPQEQPRWPNRSSPWWSLQRPAAAHDQPRWRRPCRPDRNLQTETCRGRRQAGDLRRLATRSEDFRVRWASHDVRAYVTGVKRIHHPLVGDLELPFETSPVGADPGQYLLFYTAEPDSRSHESLKIMASWSTSDQLIDASPTDTDPS
jgi:hypothetical protein